MTKRTPQLESAILEGFAEGTPLNVMCRRHGIAPMTFHTWMWHDPELAEQYAIAQAVHAQAMFEEAIAIAHDPTSQWVERRAPATGEDRDVDHIRHARARIDTCLRIARSHQRSHDAARDRAASAAAPRAPSPTAAAPPRDTDDPPPPAAPADAIAILEEAHRAILRGDPPLQPRAVPYHMTAEQIAAALRQDYAMPPAATAAPPAHSHPAPPGHAR